MAIATAVVIALIVAWFLVSPFWQEEEGGPSEAEKAASAQYEEKRRLEQALSDLELDFGTEKIEESDYTRNKERIEQRLAEIS